MTDQAGSSSARRGPRPMAGFMVLGSLVALALISWLVIQWIMAPPLAGERSFDFGTVTIKQSPTWVNHVFLLENPSGDPLTIRRAVPNCGCTEVPKLPPVIPAGGTLELPVRMKFKRSVREKADVTLTFENAAPMKLYVEGAGRLANPIIVEPPSLRLRPGQARPVSITMESWEDRSREIPEIEVPAEFQVQRQPWRRVRASQAVRGLPMLDRTVLQLEVPPGVQPMNTVIRVILDDQVVEIPVEVAPVFSPVDRAATQESPGVEVQDDPGATQSAIPSPQPVEVQDD